jgi:hypothetical protein
METTAGTLCRKTFVDAAAHPRMQNFSATVRPRSIGTFIFRFERPMDLPAD